MESTKLAIFVLIILLVMGMLLPSCKEEQGRSQEKRDKSSALSKNVKHTHVANQISVIDVPGREVIFIKNLDAEHRFHEFYRFQYAEGSAAFLSGKQGFYIHSVSDQSIVIKCGDNSLYTFSFENGITDGLTGYGLERNWGYFTYDLERENPIISISTEGVELPKPNNFTCHSGGEGANSCGTNSENPITATGCSVSCNTGYYACCDAHKHECKCFDNDTHQPYVGPQTAPTTFYAYS